MYRLSDEVLLEFLHCGALNLQYILHTTQEEKQLLSQSSIRHFRRKVEVYNEENGCDLIKDEFERISTAMAVEMGLLRATPTAAMMSPPQSLSAWTAWRLKPIQNNIPYG